MDSWCPGGVQTTSLINDCPLGTGTPTTQTSSLAGCVVIPCDPCGGSNPDLYITSQLSVFKQPAWQPGFGSTQNTAELQCTLDSTDPVICSQTAQGCVTNDIAIDNQGNYLVLGRSKSSGTGTGWVIKIDPSKIVAGQPCPYTVLLNNLVQPWAGFGAAPRSDLFYGLGDGAVFTVQVAGGTANILGSVSNVNFTGAADVTAGPDGKIYAVVGSNGAYEIPVDSNYIPTGTTTQLNGGGLNMAGAFCTSVEPYGVSGTNADAYSFLNNTPPSYNNVGGSGFTSGITGTAVAPVCGF